LDYSWVKAAHEVLALSRLLSGSECGEECYKLCVALLLCCNNYNYTLKTLTASRFFSALCGNIKRRGCEFFSWFFLKKGVYYNYKPLCFLLHFFGLCFFKCTNSTPPFLIFQEYKKAQKIGLPVVHGLLIVQFFSLAQLWCAGSVISMYAWANYVSLKLSAAWFLWW